VNRFTYANVKDFAEAGALLADKRYSLPVLKAGGLDVLDHMKEGLLEPDLLINIRTLRSGAEPVSIKPIGDSRVITIDATTTLTELARSGILTRECPAIAQACGSAATPQVRNVGTAAGNLLQRPRCWYYRQEQFECLKKGGSTCFAVEGENKFHAIFGDGPCHIVHPSNLAVALMVCNGAVEIAGAAAPMPLADLFHMPDKGVKTEHSLKPTDIITAIQCKSAGKSGFYAIKEKQSFDWPLVMVAANLSLDGDVIKSARIVAGAVAPVPWPLPAVEKALVGVSFKDDAGLRKATAVAADGAKPMSQNSYKVQLLPVAVRRAVLKAVGTLVEDHS